MTTGNAEFGSRVNDVDGSTAFWRVLVGKHSMGGLLPFFLDWGDYKDSRTAVPVVPQGCTLESFQ